MSRGSAAMPIGSVQESAQLREQVPSAQERASAALLADLRLVAGSVTDAQRQGVAPLLADPSMPAEGKVFVAASAAEAPRIILHRTPSSSPDDTGWSVAAATAGAGADWSAVNLSAFRQSRPDLADLLGLAPGFSVIMDASGVESILDPRQQTVWHRE